MKKIISVFVIFIPFLLSGCGEVTEVAPVSLHEGSFGQSTIVTYNTSFTIIQRYQLVGGTKILNVNIGGANSNINPPSSIGTNFQTMSSQIVEEGETYETIGYFSSIYCEWLNAQVPTMYWEINGIWQESHDMQPSSGGQVYLKWVPMNLTPSTTYTMTAYVN